MYLLSTTNSCILSFVVPTTLNLCVLATTDARADDPFMYLSIDIWARHGDQILLTVRPSTARKSWQEQQPLLQIGKESTNQVQLLRKMILFLDDGQKMAYCQWQTTFMSKYDSIRYHAHTGNRLHAFVLLFIHSYAKTNII